MATVHDVAAFILEERGRTEVAKLHRLIYFCQAWSLVWDRKPLFDEVLLAWPDGPVSEDLQQMHWEAGELAEWPFGDPATLTDEGKETIDAVLDSYGPMPLYELNALLSRDTAWRLARRWLSAEVIGCRPISHAAMLEYYAPHCEALALCG